jgi:hypothetical protein
MCLCALEHLKTQVVMSQFIYVFELYLTFLCQCLHMSSSESDDSSDDGEFF